MRFWKVNYCNKPPDWPNTALRLYDEKGLRPVPNDYSGPNSRLCILNSYRNLIDLLQTQSDAEKQAAVNRANENVILKGLGAIVPSDGPAYDINRVGVAYTYIPSGIDSNRGSTGLTYRSEVIQEEGAKGSYANPARYTSSTDWKKYDDKTHVAIMDREHGMACANRSPFTANGYFRVASDNDADDIVRGRGGSVSRGDDLYYTRASNGNCYLIGKFPKVKFTVKNSAGATITQYRKPTPKETWAKALGDVIKKGHRSTYFIFDPSWGKPTQEMVTYAKLSRENATLMLRPKTLKSKEAYETYLVKILSAREIANAPKRADISSGVEAAKYYTPQFFNGRYTGKSLPTPNWNPRSGVSDAQTKLLQSLPNCNEAVSALAAKVEKQLLKEEFEDALAEKTALDRSILIEAGYLQATEQDRINAGGLPGDTALGPGETADTAANEVSNINWVLVLGVAGLGFVAFKALGR